LNDNIHNTEQANFYKQKILGDYPKSDYAKLIKNPKYVEDMKAEKSEVEKTYTATYEAYASGNYEAALQACNEAGAKYGKSDFTPRFEFIRAMSAGKLKGIDTLESALRQLTILFPKSEVTPKANEILLAIKKQKNPNLFATNTNTTNPNGNPNLVNRADTFMIDLEGEHFVMIISPDDPKMANPFKTAIDEFDREYYSNQTFSIVSNLYAKAQQMILVKSFPDARSAYNYMLNLKNEEKIYKAPIIKEALSFYIISSQNVPFFYKKANTSSYKAFYDENYKTIFANPK
jgi:hypothetical protein